jgi:hypothetical protein
VWTWLLGAVLLAAVSVAAVAQTPKDPGKSAHFELRLQSSGLAADLPQRLVAAGLAGLESAWPVMQKLLPPAAAASRVLHVHVARETFRAAAGRMVPEPVQVEVAVAADGSEAHVLLWPPWSPTMLREFGLPRTTIDNLVLAAVQQLVRVHLGDQADPWLAGVVAFGVLETWRNGKRLYGVDAEYDSRRYWSHTMGGDRVDSLEAMVHDGGEVKDRLNWDVRAANRALVAEQLGLVDPLWVKKLLAKWRTRRGGAIDGEARADLVVAMLGGSWDKAQARYAATSQAMRPFWQVSAGDLWREGDTWILVGSPEPHANAYGQQPVPAGDYVIRGAIEVGRPRGDGPFRIQLGWDGASMLGVFFEPPGVSVSEWRAADSEWHELRTVPGGLVAGQLTDFRVEVAPPSLRLKLDGRAVLELPLGQRSMRGTWGIAIGDDAARLHGLTVEALRPAPK